jgi:hypothetical protein
MLCSSGRIDSRGEMRLKVGLFPKPISKNPPMDRPSLAEDDDEYLKESFRLSPEVITERRLSNRTHYITARQSA